MSLDGGMWKLWRDAPGFCQRYTGTRSPISGAWEKSRDGADWEHDFDLVYTRIR